MKPLVQWSPSALKMFEQCHRKYHEVRVLKNYKIAKGEKQLYGDELHAACDTYIKGGPMMSAFEFMKPIIDSLLAKPHDKKFGERKMAVTTELAPCEYFDKRVWVRGVSDLLIINTPARKARVVDWKTGNNRYPEYDQLDIMALLTFEHFPAVDEISAALIYVLKNDMKKRKYHRRDKDVLWWRYRERVARIEQAHQSGVWNPMQSGLCGWCEVMTCEMNPKH